MTQSYSFLRALALAFGLLLAYPAWSQELISTSDTMRLDFGYPLLKAKNDLTFLEQNENGQIDSAEGCAITFTLLNDSRYPARNVYIRPKELNGIAGLVWRKEIKIGNIAAQGSREVEIGIIAKESLGQGTANFAFTILEGDDVESATVVYSVPVNQPNPPGKADGTESTDDRTDGQ
jgi:hypothetical protein